MQEDSAENGSQISLSVVRDGGVGRIGLVLWVAVTVETQSTQSLGL